MGVKRCFYGLVLALSMISLFATACEKETETITVTNTIIQKDTVITIVRDTIRTTDTLVNLIRDTATTFILVRHAETQSGSNPILNTNGQLRANKLRDILANVSLDAVYSTNFNRTRQTGQPTATAKSLFLINYDPFNLSPFVDSVLANHHDGIVLVVGHSNTTPSLLNELLGSTVYSNIPETEYDNMYVVTVFEKGRSEVVHLKY